MGYPTRDNRSGGGRSFGGRNFGGGRDMGRPQMHKATCSTCGNECEIPFKPTGDRPVYCRDCFAKNRSSDSGKSFGRDDRQTPRPAFRKYDNDSPAQSNRNEQMDTINSKLDQILKLLSTLTPQMTDEKIATAESVTPQEKIEIPVKKKRTSKKKTETTEEAPIE